jgi:hypothetical protein
VSSFTFTNSTKYNNYQLFSPHSQEFERQVSAGKFNIEPVMPAPPPAPIVPPATKVLQQQNNGNKHGK